MTSSLDSGEQVQPKAEVRQPRGWLRVAGVAALSALAGGLAAVWWHRKTLEALRESAGGSQNPDFRSAEGDPADEA